MTTTKQTFCRICEPLCPMLAEVNERGEAIKLMPNPEHPLGSEPCHKGLSFLQVHNDPDRLNWPLKSTQSRTDSNRQFGRVSWEDALKEAGQKIRALREELGPNSIAVYVGNPPSFNSRSHFIGQGFATTLGTAMHFSAGTQDTMNKVAGSAATYGTVAFTVPDLYNTDYLLCIGGNPKVSHWTSMSVPNDAGNTLKAIKDRGGKVCFVNPRKIESSTPETGDTLLIKPDTDVYFLAAVLNEIQLQGGFDEAFLSQHTRHLPELIEFIGRYPASEVADITGISVTQICEVASDIMTAESAVSYFATGVNQGRQGSLCYLLNEMINLCTGNFGRDGGSYIPKGFVNILLPATYREPVETSVGTISPCYGADQMPFYYLAELIESGDIRALINIGGNPLITAPGGVDLRSALEKLDTLITIDILPNEVSDLADYVLPACDWLEREDINLLSAGLQLVPYVQYTDQVVDSKEERRNDWWILSRLLQEIGLPSPLDDPDHRDGKKFLDELLGSNDLSIDQIKKSRHFTKFLEQGDRGNAFAAIVKHEDNKIDCFPEVFVRTGLVDRCDKIFKELTSEDPDTLKLISLRTNYMHNSWLGNVPNFHRGLQSHNPLNMCSADAERLGLFDGEEIRVFNQYGHIQSQLLINDDLRPGTVAMTHGYGREKVKRMAVANSNPGSNCNVLMPNLDSEYAYEPLSAMTWMNGVPVSVERTAN